MVPVPGPIPVAWSCEVFISPARRKDTGRIPEGCQTSVKRPVRKSGIALQLYLHAGRIPEGYRKDTGRVTDPLTDLLTDPLTDLLTDPLTDLLKDLLTNPSIRGPRLEN